MKFTQNIIFIALCAISAVAFSQGDKSTITIGKKDSLRSEILRETRPYWRYLPPSYDDRTSGPVSYPVLYLLDGNAHFHSVTGLIDILGTGINGTFVIPEMIVVAIPNIDRTRDLTPSHSTIDPQGNESPRFKSSGGGPAFLSFIKNELIPTIDKTYRTSSYRLFVGHSFGGIAVINALYTMPETFNSYLAIDPSFWWDNQLLLKKAKEFFAQSNLQGKSLFLAQANTLPPDGKPHTHFQSIRDYVDVLKNQNSGIQWDFKYYENDTHGSVPMISEYDGLRFIFQGYSPKTFQSTSPAELKKQYETFSQRVGAKFLPPERVVFQLASVAETQKQPDVAEQYYKMNIENYPASMNAHFSMGEFLKNKGNTTAALPSYEQALKLAPDNEKVKAAIKTIREAGAKK